jgi:hypothetical protein
MRDAKIAFITLVIGLFLLVAWLLRKHDVDTLIIPPDAVLPDGSRYYGDVLDGHFHGEGRLVFADGGRYEGDFLVGLISGRGELTYADGSVYRGEFKGGKLEGQGRFETEEKNVYEGMFADNMSNGPGVFLDVDGSKYEGDFRNWKFHGKGVYTNKEEGSYTGDFVAGRFTGAGIFKDTKDNRYAGEFLNWKFHGQGTYTSVSGDEYSGAFDNGSFTGKGSYKNKDGGHYIGEFKNWLYHGQGTYTDKDGDVYTGSFSNGYFHGQGEMVFAEARNGLEKQSGEWSYGYFNDPDEEIKQARLKTSIEQALYTQNELLDDAFGKLLSGEAGVPDLYFVGVAGDGDQDVFLKEIRFIQQLFDESFGTTGRSIVLVNNPATMPDTPLATRIALSRTLQAAAGKMDAEDDILFLYLTSHGSEDHRFSINQHGLLLPDLPAKAFAEMVNALPVKWKVVVVSACYSGGFISYLKNENTLMMTAASSKRQSFGCSDTSEMTWFGKAYFREALPRASSFEDAFKIAEKLIYEWELVETEKGAEHSQPQIFAGKNIGAHLKRWWGRIDEQRQLALPADADTAAGLVLEE